MGRRKHHDSTRVFDVSKPGRSTPSPTSRPVIVSHRQVADDPMVTGNEGSDAPALMTHANKSVVPIEINSHQADTDTAPAKHEDQPPADNFFGNTPEEPSSAQEPPANEQTAFTPPATAEPVSDSVEPFSGSASPDASPANQPAPAANDNSPADTAAPSEPQPLPAELTAPEADDPVGLSNSNPVEPQPTLTPGAVSGAPGQPVMPVEQKAENKSQDGKPDNAETQKTAEQLPAVPENIGDIETIPFPAHPHHVHYTDERRSKRWLVPSLILLLVGGFLVLDAGIIGSGNLPVEIFKEQDEATAEISPSVSVQPAAQASQKPDTTQPPLGFSEYRLLNTPLSFSYPSAWGNPTATADPGFSKRGGNNKSDGIYTHLISFENNKDIQIALTSNKYLPANRAAEYYDFLQWCSGTHDAKIYRQKLLFSTASGVDTPTTTTCSDGPLADVTIVDDNTIVQANAKDTANKSIGDIYTKNLADKEFVVIRIKDSSRTNAATIKDLLTGVKLAGQTGDSN